MVPFLRGTGRYKKAIIISYDRLFIMPTVKCLCSTPCQKKIPVNLVKLFNARLPDNFKESFFNLSYGYKYNKL